MSLSSEHVGLYDFIHGYKYRVRPVLVSGQGMHYVLQFRTFSGIWQGSLEEDWCTFLATRLTKIQDEWRTWSEMRYYRRDGTAISLTEQPQA